MSDKYYRLVTFVIDICPKPMRELFITKAKADPNIQYTNLEDYLLFRKPDIDKLLRRSKISLDQLDHIYPASGCLNIQIWDFTLLSTLVRSLFGNMLQQDERVCLDVITSIINKLQHISSTKTITDKEFNSCWSALKDAALTLSKFAGAPPLLSVTEEIASALNENLPNLGDVLRTWHKVLYVQLQLQNSELEKKLDLQAAEIEILKEESKKSSTILSKASVKRKGRTGIAEKRLKIVDNKIERMRETLSRALSEKNDCIESSKNDITLITEQLTDNHRVIVTGHDNTLSYKCALAAITELKFQRLDQCLEINNPSDWKRICSEDARCVLFREPFGRASYDPHKVETMLEEFDSMIDATNSDDENVTYIIIVTNQSLLQEVRRKHDHEMLSAPSTVYIDSTTDNIPDDQSAADAIVHRNLVDVSKMYKNTCSLKTEDTHKKCLAEKLFLEHNTVAIVGPAASGKTSLSLQLLSSYDLSNGEENFLLIVDPGELKYVNFSLKPVIIIKLLAGLEFDKHEAFKWYRHFDRLLAAVQQRKAAVICVVETEVFRMWQAHIPSHPVLKHIVYMPGTKEKEKEKQMHDSTMAESVTERSITTSLEKKSLCEPCSFDDIFVEAAYFCTDCKEMLCYTCSKIHKKFKISREHKIVENPLEAHPGRPQKVVIQPDSITLAWDPPKNFRKGDYYQISYKDARKDVKWQIHQSEPTTTCITVTRLRSDTVYIFRVRVVHEDGEEGPYSIVSEEIQTLPSLALQLTERSSIIEKKDESPTIYKLPVYEIRESRNRRAHTRQFTVGEPVGDYVESKTILLMGATGSGKSVFVDSIINYVLGVTWEDPFRFTAVSECEDEIRFANQALSQTQWINCYTINPEKGSRLNYQLTVIDTPGFGDTRGLMRDQQIVEQIRTLFAYPEPKGITFIDAVCFLVKAPDARLTAVQSYIFQSVMALFGKDIENNICSVITFADGTESPVSSALRASGLPFGKSFPFNNSCLLSKNFDLHAAESLSYFFWEMGMNSFQAFFKHLDQLQTKSLRLTHDVIIERRRLQTLLRNLKESLDIGFYIVSTLQQEKKIIDKNKSLIEKNINFEYEVEETQQIRVPLPDGDHEIKCRECNFNCRINCSCEPNRGNFMCKVIDSLGFCENCPGKCIWKKHNTSSYKYESVVVKVKRTYEDMKAKYSGAAEKVSIHKEIVEKNEQELTELTQNIEDMIFLINRCNQRLREIALRPHSLSVTDYIALLLTEENMAENRNSEKVKLLEQLHRRLCLQRSSDLSESYSRMTLSEKPAEAEFQRITMLLRSYIPNFEL